MIVNIRGTSGSGKTHTVRHIMALATAAGYGLQPMKAIDGKVKAYWLRSPGAAPHINILGSYENVCGGMDAIETQDEACQLVRHYTPYGHVVFEGLLMSHLFSRYHALDRELQPVHYVWAFLDTPMDLCLDRVRQRRAARGVTKPLNPTNTVSKWHDMRRVYDKCIASGLDARWVDHTTAGDTIFGWLKSQ